MRIIGRIITYLIVFFFTSSISYVLAMRFVPITITPIKVVRWVESVVEGEGWFIYSKWQSLEGMNKSLPRAVIAAEDSNFTEHHGFDIDAIKKAYEYNKRHGENIRGASTISQQTAKNVFCLPSRTWVRKGFESYYTILIELMWGKPKIMEAYLNIIETQPNVYGVESTARRFYDKESVDINVYEASIIAALLPHPLRSNLKSPSYYLTTRARRIRAGMQSVKLEALYK